jgi:hypothetical protein
MAKQRRTGLENTFQRRRGMKILAISCSPNPRGNTVSLLNQVLDGVREEGGEAELYSVSGKAIEPQGMQILLGNR